MGPGDMCRVSLAAVRYGRARQTSESGPCWDCKRVQWVPDPWFHYSGKLCFIEKRGVQDEGYAMLLNMILTPGKSSPKSNFNAKCCKLLMSSSFVDWHAN